jgi:nicotinamidase-related amidase
VNTPLAPLVQSRSALLMVDVQSSLVPFIDQAVERVNVCQRLARAARALQIDVLATEHVPQKLGHSEQSLQPLIDAALQKSHFDATREQAFHDFVPSHCKQIILVGCEAHVCVMQTALGLLRKGYDVWLATDGCGSRHDADRQLAFDRLSKAGATLVCSEMVMFEWLDHASHTAFRDVLSIIKSRDQG